MEKHKPPPSALLPKTQKQITEERAFQCVGYCYCIWVVVTIPKEFKDYDWREREGYTNIDGQHYN